MRYTRNMVFHTSKRTYSAFIVGMGCFISRFDFFLCSGSSCSKLCYNFFVLPCFVKFYEVNEDEL